ncbi:MAG: phosphoribosylformylglycinamidine synthase [Bacillota bacterium]
MSCESTVKRIFVEKKQGFDIEAKALLSDIKINLNIQNLESLRIINRYDVEGIADIDFSLARTTIFSEPNVDDVFDETLELCNDERAFAVELLPGQYDQRADSATQCIQMLTEGERPIVRAAKMIVIRGQISASDFLSIKSYLINPIDSGEVSLDKPNTLEMELEIPQNVEILIGFISYSSENLNDFLTEKGLAMSLDDLVFTQEYFKNDEKRDPTITEIRMLDTYWSDHCRHTTFLTNITNVEIEESPLTKPISEAYEMYLNARKDVYGERISKKPVCLMDMATIAMKHLRDQGRLPDLDESEEINACSIVVEAEIDGGKEDWLVMFKNETHNHPTEIEPFGGAATCLGGAIRDPLSGRVYVYQAMRVTGSGDPRAKLSETLPGKLPQRKISAVSASGYSSYGNQIGLSTGKVAEIYDEGYVAKRMEIGAVVGAAPKENVRRERPVAGDIIVLLGGRTGRDGCGGATGSSKEHDEASLASCGAEVQKGNPPTERKIQRLFRNPKVSKMIKRCNDFGAGGISVAIGELADGLDINLDLVPKKYEGLDGTELAISESQERMAVVLNEADVKDFIFETELENLEATVVATVTDDNRLRMTWRGEKIVDLCRDFINTNGVAQKIDVKISAPKAIPVYKGTADIKSRWFDTVSNLNSCSQKGLGERFDGSIGAGSVLMPFGGKNQLTPTEGMVAKLPVLTGVTDTVTFMAHGFNNKISRWSPFHGAVFAVVESVTRLVVMGADFRKVRLTLQEYFEKLSKNSEKWGKPAAALLGAMWIQEKLGIAAIGGKDSMSGTFMDLDVPPTLVSFAIAPGKASNVITNHFKKAGSKLVLLKTELNELGLPDIDSLISTYEKFEKTSPLSAGSIKVGGLSALLTEMAAGNMLGFELESIANELLFKELYGSILIETDSEEIPEGAILIGKTVFEKIIKIGDTIISLDECISVWRNPLEKTFPTKSFEPELKPEKISYSTRNMSRPDIKFAKPRIFIPAFPGTNCETDSARRFAIAGGVPEILVVRNLTGHQVEESVEKMVEIINNSQIIMFPGGFSAGDEPEGSGKFIATAFRNPKVAEAVMKLLNERDGLILGVCNGFQALIKLGLLPFGEIRNIDESCPTLTYNNIGRHVSCYVTTRVSSVLSPWLAKCDLGDMHTIPVSHGEGRFVADGETLKRLQRQGQITFQYTDLSGSPSNSTEFNPNGSTYAVEGITSPDGRILGKMGHSERIGKDIAINIYGEKDQKIFEAGVEYFKS